MLFISRPRRLATPITSGEISPGNASITGEPGKKDKNNSGKFLKILFVNPAKKSSYLCTNVG